MAPWGRLDYVCIHTATQCNIPTHAGRQDEHPELRPKPGQPSWWSGEERAWFARALAGSYVDSFRLVHPDAERYSFWDQVKDARGRNAGLRIDYVLVSRTGWGAAAAAAAAAAGGGGGEKEEEAAGVEKGEPKIVAAEVLLTALRTTRASDHAPVMCELALPPPSQEAQPAAGGPKQVGCVKGKVEGSVILQKLLPDKRQKSIKGFFAKKARAPAPAPAPVPVPAAAAAASSAKGSAEEPAAKKAKTEEGKKTGGGGGGPMMKYLGAPDTKKKT